MRRFVSIQNFSILNTTPVAIYRKVWRLMSKHLLRLVFLDWDWETWQLLFTMESPLAVDLGGDIITICLRRLRCAYGEISPICQRIISTSRTVFQIWIIVTITGFLLIFRLACTKKRQWLFVFGINLTAKVYRFLSHWWFLVCKLWIKRIKMYLTSSLNHI